MNTEKAIDLLDNLILMMFEDDYESDYDTALRMAIDVLKTQADGDTISRQAVIDALEKVAELFPWRVPGNRDSYDRYNEAWNDAIGRAEIEIEKLPSAQPETHEKRTETHACDCIDQIDRESTIEPHCESCEAFNKTRLLIPQPERKKGMWIPCSERLPDELAEVNITWINTNPVPYYEFTKGKPNTGSAVYYKGRWYWYSAVCADYLAEYGFSPDDDMDDAIKVIAWMPLPEPYKEPKKCDTCKHEKERWFSRCADCTDYELWESKE